MTGNRSLDDFLGGDVDDENDEPEVRDENSDRGDAESVDVDAGVDAAPVEPATPTYRWDRDGGVCARCGETVQQRWADGDTFVCGGCKEW